MGTENVAVSADCTAEYRCRPDGNNAFPDSNAHMGKEKLCCDCLYHIFGFGLVFALVVNTLFRCLGVDGVGGVALVGNDAAVPSRLAETIDYRCRNSTWILYQAANSFCAIIFGSGVSS